MENKKSSERKRHFTFILYPESCAENWRDILDDYHIAWCVSPLHDSDINGDGTPKKPHWHVVLTFEGKKTVNQVQAMSDACKGTLVQDVHSLKAIVRYLVHMDNPEKHQYDVKLIEAHGGFEIDDYIESSRRKKYDVLKEILQYISENDIVEYEDIMMYAMYNNDEWFEALADSCTYVVNAYVKSRRHRRGSEHGDK